MPAPELSSVLTFTGELPDYLNQQPKVFAQNANRTVLQWQNVLLSYNSSLAEVNEALIYIDAQVAAAQQKVVDAGTAGATQVALAVEQVTAAQNFAGAAEDSADLAAAAANNYGAWSELTGAFPAGAAVNHDGNTWISNVAIAAIEASEPAGGNSDWFNYTAAISGLTPVASNTDTTSGRAITVGWLGFGANDTAPVFTDLDNVTKINALFFRAAAGATNAPTTKTLAGRMTQLNASGAFMQEVAWSNDGAAGYAYRFTDPDNSAVWQATWIVPANNILFGVTDQAAALTALGAARAGAIADALITMAANRMLGASEAGAPQEWTSSQVRDFISARVASSKITSATARIAGRVASGTGDLQELDADDVYSILGISTQAVTLSSGGFLVSSKITFFKILGKIFGTVEFEAQPLSSSTANVVRAGVVPAAYRPSSEVSVFIVTSAGYVVQTLISTGGTVTLSRSDSIASASFGNAAFSY